MRREENPGTRRERLSKIHQIVIGCAGAALFILGVEGILAIDRGAEVRLFDIDSQNRWSMTIRDGRDRIKIKSRGDVDIVEDGELPTLEIADGGRLEIDARWDGERRKLDARGTADGIDFDYRVDGDTRPLDADGREWLGEMLLEAVRTGGLDARERALNLYAAGGLRALDAELAHIRGEGNRGRYLIAVLDEDPADRDLAALLTVARQRLDGDYPLLSLLESVTPGRLADSGVAEAYFGAVRSLDSDHHRRRMLSHVMEGVGGDQWSEFFRAAATLDSDHEAAALVLEFSGYSPTAVPTGLLQLIKGIDGDHQQSRAIEALFTGPLDAESRDALLSTAAAELSTDHEAAELLIIHAQHAGGATPSALTLLRTIDTDHLQGRAFEALTESADAAELPALVGAATIDTDHVLARALLHLHGRGAGSDPELRRAVETAAERLDNEVQRRRVQEAWGLGAGP
ncbi:MAG: hypothetical protein AAGM22_24015 [Acidobacteriota bacterium]